MKDILLLDDEMLVIEAIKENIDWEAVGAGHVYLCDNVSAAMELCQTHEIALAVSDIEMPGGVNGITFAGWLREHVPDTAILFLTGYAQFSYAKAAVALKAEDYILKPVRYDELAKKISDILKKAALREKEKQMQSIYTLKQGELMDDFIRFALKSKEEFRGTQLQDLCERFHMGFSSESRFLLLWIHFLEKSAPDYNDTELIKKEFYEAYEEAGVNIFISGFSIGKLCICLEYTKEHLPVMDKARSVAAAIIEKRPEPCCCFFSELLQIEQMIPALRKLADRDAKNVLYQNKVVLVGNRNIYSEESSRIDYGKWAVLLEDADMKKLEAAIDFTVQSIVVSGKMDAAALRKLYNNFMQIVYHYIGANFSSRQDIAADESLNELQERAVLSVEDFRRFVRRFLQQIEMLQRAGNVENIVENVKKYIEGHIREKISRTDIAEYVALSENYLSRLFHKETGMSISDYILQKRLNMAKKLLIQTNMSISGIGETVGYETTAYFIRLFKRELGITPKEYRKQMRI